VAAVQNPSELLHHVEFRIAPEIELYRRGVWGLYAEFSSPRWRRRGDTVRPIHWWMPERTRQDFVRKQKLDSNSIAIAILII
jgi:hypothetical protein